MTDRTCPLGEDCDLTVAWMAGRKDAEDALARRAVILAVQAFGQSMEAEEWEDWIDAILARAKGGEG